MDLRRHSKDHLHGLLRGVCPDDLDSSTRCEALRLLPLSSVDRIARVKIEPVFVVRIEHLSACVPVKELTAAILGVNYTVAFFQQCFLQQTYVIRDTESEDGEGLKHTAHPL